MLARIVKKDAPDVVTSFFNFEPKAANQIIEETVTTFDFAQTVDDSIHQSFAPAHAGTVSIEDILQEARDEAAQILAQAEAQSQAIEQAARDRAKIEVRAELEAESQTQVADLREELAATLAEISGLREEITAQAETQLVELALEIAKKVVGREVMFDREIALTLVKVSLSRLQTHSAARIHLHPEDFAFVNAQRERLNFHGALEIIEDRSISLGGCLIRTETGDIDTRIESQFEEIAHGLLGK
jgi:flagellar assembly protein FliH